MDVERLIQRAQQGDLDAFAEVTRRFQHMAFGYAVALLRDLQQAEDVVQEAFVAAWFGLRRLADPAAFPGWLRGIVRHQAYRILRRRPHAPLPLEAAFGVAANGTPPDRRAEDREQVAAVLGAIAGLPSPVREVTTLFYVHDCTQQDIATFLSLPVTTVNNRLHAARQQLKRGTLTMVKDTLEAHRLPDDFAARIGRIVRTREGVVEVLFDPTSLPDPLTELTVSDTPRRRAVTVQVVQLLEGGVVRCIPLSPADGLTAGMTVLSAGRRIEAPAGREAVDRAVRLLAGPVREPDRAPELLPTGIKVIDVMCPLVRGGTVAVAGELRAGASVVVEELCRRLSREPGGVSIFAFIPPYDGPERAFQEMWAKEGYTGGTAGTVQTFYFLGQEEWTAERLATLPSVDAVIRLSKDLAQIGIYPTVDPLVSRSRLLDMGLVDPEHAEIAARIRQALAPTAAEELNSRARKVQRFFAQPFYVAEPYTHRPGVTVSRAEALQVCREILDGVHDRLPEAAFYFTGGMDEIRAKVEVEGSKP
ncbi:MAG TPA: sigma-70 family RNA polymerase sigma factor [Methylomirabilota bacterium]|nr:sigma-70 family RNA polymerase sigma factor [Methylomirabilota bacterium]